MSTATKEPKTKSPKTSPPAAPELYAKASDRKEFSAKLRNLTIACRVRHEKMGVRKSLTPDQLRKVAEVFDAERKAFAATKRLIDTSHPAYRDVVRVRAAATEYWKSHTVPYPDPGVRLIRKDEVEAFEAKMTELRKELEEKAGRLQEVYADLRSTAQQDLGETFNEADYPARIDTEFSLSWDFPSIDPPEHLKKISPLLYEQEQAKVSARFEEAVRLTEEALASRLAELVSHLAERLKGDIDGKPKVFRDTAVENLASFFEEFKRIDLGSNDELQKLVNQAQELVKGIAPDDLRSNVDVRSKVADGLIGIEKMMEGLMLEKPKRAISLEGEE